MSVSQEGILAIAYRSIDERWGRRERRAIRSAITESLLADLLRLRVGASTSSWALSRNHAGKPTLTNTAGAIRVSLSHSHLFALAAISDLGEIGVDVEVRDPSRSMSEIASYAFGPQEQRVVKSDGPRAFYRIWTLREAFAKARGLGFSILADGRDYFPRRPTPAFGRPPSMEADGSSRPGTYRAIARLRSPSPRNPQSAIIANGT